MKDYANRNFNYSDSVNQQDKVPIHWGFIVAALVAMLVIYSVWRHVQQKSVVHPVAVVTAAATVASAPAVTNAKAQQVTPAAVATPAKTATPPVKFDFYQMLTESPNAKKTASSVDVSVSSAAKAPSKVQTTSQNSAPVTDTQAGTNTNTRYYIQVGSYKSKADALQQKANLILSEVTPKLIKVTGSNGHYRVLVGPYSNQESAAAERSDLKQNGIDGSLVNLKK